MPIVYFDIQGLIIISQLNSIYCTMKLNEYRRCFTLSYQEFITEYKIRSSQVHEHVSYEKVKDVTRVTHAENEFFFFKGGILKVIYLSRQGITTRLWDEISPLVTIEKPEDSVRSRAGKTSNQLIFAKDGITISLSKSEPDFIELYLPCSLQDYLDTIYDEPGPFIR